MRDEKYYQNFLPFSSNKFSLFVRNTPLINFAYHFLELLAFLYSAVTLHRCLGASGYFMSYSVIPRFVGKAKSCSLSYS